MTAAAMVMAWRPFLDPINMQESWYWLLIPLSVGVAVVYKAVKLPSLEKYWRHVLVMTTQIVVGMLLLAAASYALVLVYAKFIAERAG